MNGRIYSENFRKMKSWRGKMKKLFLISCFLMICTGVLMAQNNALMFDGSDDYIDLTDMNLDGDFTLEAWINLDDFSVNYRPILSKNKADGTGNYNCEFNLQVHLSSGNLDFFMGNGSGYGVILDANTSSDQDINLSQWYHVAVTVDGIVCTMYLNGVQVDQENFSGTRLTGSQPVQIGRYNAGSLQLWDGKIDEVRIWNTVRTKAEIRANMYKELTGTETGLIAYYKFNETSGTTLDDATSNNNDGTLNNMTGSEWQASAAFAGPKNCLDFDGTDDYVDLSSPTTLDTLGQGSFTIEAWIKTSNTDTRQVIVGNYDGIPAYVLELHESGNLRLYVNDTGYNSSTEVDDGQWHHVAGVRELNSDIKLYVDGVEVYSYGSDPEGAFTVINNTMIGRNPSSEYALPFNGQIDEVRIWKTARTAAQIRENMCRTLTGNETGLVTYYNFDNYSGTKLQDFSGNNNDGTLTNMDAATDWVSSAAFNTWLNTNSTAWNTVTNWSRGSAPASTDNVGIVSYTGGSNPALSGSPTVNNLVVGSSATLTLSSGATVNGNLILESDLDLNGQTITLGSAGKLVESSGFLSGATGQIQTTRDLSNIDENVAGLGAEITTSANMGSTTIIRGHEAQGSQGIKRYYQINPTTNTGLSATLVFHYRDAELNGQTESELKLFKSSDGSTWTEQASSTVNTTDNTLTLSGIDGFSSWTAAPTGSDASLPVELVSFTAESRSGSVILRWSTESELENLGFMLQRRKSEADEWEPVADYLSDAALAGNGSTTEKHDYQYTDKTLQPGLTYEYRLGDVDYSGRVTWHKEVRVKIKVEDVKMPVEFGLHRAYPNPFNPAVTLSYGLEAALVSAYQLPGAYDIIWQPKNLGAGVYILRLQSGNKTNLQKIVFVK